LRGLELVRASRAGSVTPERELRGEEDLSRRGVHLSAFVPFLSARAKCAAGQAGPRGSGGERERTIQRGRQPANDEWGPFVSERRSGRGIEMGCARWKALVGQNGCLRPM
jgi:hypothetical protein